MDRQELRILELLKLTHLKVILRYRLQKISGQLQIIQAYSEIDQQITTRHQNEPYLRLKYDYSLAKAMLKCRFSNESLSMFIGIKKKTDGTFKVPLVNSAKIEYKINKIKVRYSKEIQRESDGCQKYLERHNSELEVC